MNDVGTLEKSVGKSKPSGFARESWTFSFQIRERRTITSRPI